MKNLIISAFAIASLALALSSVQAAWTCEHYCSAFMRMNGACFADHTGTSSHQNQFQ